MDYRALIIETKYNERKAQLLSLKKTNPWSVYYILNNINGLIYIGETSCTLDERWKSHIKSYQSHNKVYDLYVAMEIFGVDNFSMHLIKDNLTGDEALNLESFLIRELNTTKKGYNMLILHEINVDIIKHIINDEEFIERVNSIR